MPTKPLPSNKDIWETIASSFDTTRRKPWNEIIRFLETLQPNSTVIDIGCGNGRHLIEAVTHSTLLIGVDISRNLLQIARHKLDNTKNNTCEFIQGSATHIPLTKNSCDAALYIATLHVIRTRDQRIQSLKELHRILKPGKKALISVWSREQDRFKEYYEKNKQPHNIFKEGDIIIHWRQHNLDIPRFYHLYTKEEFIEDLKSAGLTISNLDEAKLASNKSVDNYFATVIIS